MKYVEIHPKFLNINEWDISGKSNNIGDKKIRRDTLGGFEKNDFVQNDYGGSNKAIATK